MSLQYARVEDMQEEKNIKKCVEKSIVENWKGLHVCRKQVLFSWVLNSARNEEESGVFISDKQSSIGWKRSDHRRQKSPVQGQYTYREDNQFCMTSNLHWR